MKIMRILGENCDCSVESNGDGSGGDVGIVVMVIARCCGWYRLWCW